MGWDELMKDGLVKFALKVLDENRDRISWEHFCYAPKSLYVKFLEQKGIERRDIGEYVSAWAKEDFNIDLPMTTLKDIIILRSLIKDKYSSAYPHLMRDAVIDRQGWNRVWVTTHMERDLRK